MTLTLYHLPNQSGSWLVLDGENAVWIVPNAGWEQRRPYRGSVLPCERDRILPSAERVVAYGLGLPDAPEPSPLDYAVCELWIGLQAQAAKLPDQAVSA